MLFLPMVYVRVPMNNDVWLLLMKSLEEPVSETMKEKTTAVSFAARFKDALGAGQ